jgi:anti-sigma factor RsiW
MTPLASEPIDEQQIVRFLLGELPEDERQGVEGRLFQDDSFYSLVLAIQEELADSYVQGELTADQRKQFESHFLKSPRRKERVDFAAVFAGALVQNDHAQSAVSPAAASDAKWWSSFTAFVPRLVPICGGSIGIDPVSCSLRTLFAKPPVEERCTSVAERQRFVYSTVSI